MQRKKKFCACIFAVLLAQAACLPVAFADDGKHWADETFASLLESRTVLPGEFGRADYDISITRGRFTEVFVRLLEADGPTGGGAHFTDVEEGSEHYLSSAKAKIAGLVSGHADGTFRPDAEMQRQEMFAVVGRLFAAAGADLPGGEGIRFTDGPAIAPYAADAVRRLAAAGIIKGYEDGTVKPGAPVSCAEAMAVVLRVKAALDEAAADAGVTDGDGATLPAGDADDPPAAESAPAPQGGGSTAASGSDPGNSSPGSPPAVSPAAGESTDPPAEDTVGVRDIFPLDGIIAIGIKFSNPRFLELETGDAGEIGEVSAYLSGLHLTKKIWISAAAAAGTRFRSRMRTERTGCCIYTETSF